MHRRRFLFSTLAVGLVAPLADGRFALAADPPAGLDQATGLFIDDRTLGSREAPAVMIEYASLSCPHCAEFNAEFMPRLETDWIETGKLLFVYRHFPLNAPALWGALAAECLEGQAFFAFVDMLFKQQRNWVGAEDPAAALFELAQLAGFDRSRFDRCVDDQATLDKILDRMDYATSTYDVQGTPTIVLNGTKIGARTYEELSEAIAAIVG